MLGLNLWDAIDPEQAGYTIPTQPTALPVAVPAQVQPRGIGGLLDSWFGGQRQPTQGFENLPQREEPTWREKISTVLSPALMQLGIALMSPPGQRGAILANIPATVQEGQKTLQNSALYRAQLAAWQKANTQQARSPSDIELFLASPQAFREYQSAKQKPEKEPKQYRAFTIGPDGRPNLIYEGTDQPTIHNIPREPDKPVHVIIPYGADVTKLKLPDNAIPHFQPPPSREPVQEVWKQGWETDSTGKLVPILFDTRTGNKKYLSTTGKALPGKGRLSGQAQGAAGAGQPLIPGMNDVNVGNPNDWTPNPEPAGQATFPTPSSSLQGMSLQQLIDLRNKKLRGQ